MKMIVFSDRFSVDARPKRIEMYALLNKTALVGRGLNVLKGQYSLEYAKWEIVTYDVKVN